MNASFQQQVSNVDESLEEFEKISLDFFLCPLNAFIPFEYREIVIFVNLCRSKEFSFTHSYFFYIF